MFWPSFNSAPGPDTDLTRYMAVVNTYLALCGSCMMTYATSIWATPGRKITMEHVQNATLAGGVAMGTAASMPVQPFGALIIGGVAGILSTTGYSFIKVISILLPIESKVQGVSAVRSFSCKDFQLGSADSTPKSPMI